MRYGTMRPINRNYLRNVVRGLCVFTTVVVAGFAVVPMVCADKSVTEEILEILKESDQISADQYDDMKKRAEREKNSDWAVYWKNGTHIESRDGEHRIVFGGRMLLDWAAITADDPMNAQIESAEGQTLSGNGVEFRQARLFVQGTVFEDFEFKVQYDFAGQKTTLEDAYAGLRNMPVLGNVRGGHMKEPMSIERLTSAKFITFMENPLPVQAFAPGRNTGIMAFNNAIA